MTRGREKKVGTSLCRGGLKIILPQLILCGRAVAAMTVVPLSSTGRTCLYVSTAMHLVIDVQAYLVASAQAPLGLNQIGRAHV